MVLKTSLSVCGLLLMAGSAFAADMAFTPQAYLTSDWATDSRDDIVPAVAASGTSWVIAWRSDLLGSDSTGLQIRIARSTDQGATWSDAVPLGTQVPGQTRSFMAPAVAASPSGTWIVMWRSFVPGNPISDPRLHIFRSDDDAQTFAEIQSLDPDPHHDSLSAAAGIPSLATDGDGVWIAVWRTHHPNLTSAAGAGLNGVFASRSTDDGESWSSPTPLSPNDPSLGQAFRRPFIATDERGNWLVAWRSTQAGGTTGTKRMILGVRSVNEGADWSAPERWHDPEPGPALANGDPRLAADPCGTWVMTWVECSPQGCGQGETLLASRSSDLGVTWSDPTLVTDLELWPDVSHDIATDRRGHWMVSWRQREADIAVARSRNPGASWTNETIIGGGTSSVVASNRADHWVVAWHTLKPYRGEADIRFSVGAREVERRMCWKHVWVRTPSGRYVLRRRRVACPQRAPHACPAASLRAPRWWSPAAIGIYDEWLALRADAGRGGLVTSTDGIAAWLAAAPIGRALTAERRASLQRELGAALQAPAPEQLDALVEESVNAIEVDRLGLNPVRRVLKTRTRKPVELGRLGRVEIRGVARGGTLSAKVEPGVPASLDGYAPGFPMTTYRLAYSGALEKDGEVHLELELGRTVFWRPLETLRLLEWDGDDYRDITQEVDAHRGLIRGRTSRFASYVIMQPGYDEAEFRQSRCPRWLRIFCGDRAR